MNIIAGAAILGVICAVSVPLSMARPSVRKKYAQRDDRSLVHTKVNAERMWKFCIVLTLLAPLPLSSVIALLRNARITEIMTAAMILVIMGGWANFWLYWSVAGIAKAELEFREINRRQETPNKAFQAIGDKSPQPER